jgi:hypothetical protein
MADMDGASVISSSSDATSSYAFPEHSDASQDGESNSWLQERKTQSHTNCDLLIYLSADTMNTSASLENIETPLPKTLKLVLLGEGNENDHYAMISFPKTYKVRPTTIHS